MSDARPAPAHLRGRAALTLLLPLAVFHGLTFVSWNGYAFTRLYLSTIAAVTVALLTLSALARLELSVRAAGAMVAACLITVLFVGRMVEAAGKAQAAQSPMRLLALVALIDGALLLGASCLAWLGVRRVQRPSYLLMAALVTCLADTYSVFFGPTGRLVEEHTELISSRAMLQWFVIGNEEAFPLMGVGDLLFLSFFLRGALRFGYDLRINLLAQFGVLAVAYALILGETLADNPIRLAGLMFIGPAFAVANWGRFELEDRDRRGIACLVAGLSLAIASLIVIQKFAGWPR